MRSNTPRSPRWSCQSCGRLRDPPAFSAPMWTPAKEASFWAKTAPGEADSGICGALARTECTGRKTSRHTKREGQAPSDVFWCLLTSVLVYSFTLVGLFGAPAMAAIVLVHFSPLLQEKLESLHVLRDTLGTCPDAVCADEVPHEADALARPHVRWKVGRPGILAFSHLLCVLSPLSSPRQGPKRRLWPGLLSERPSSQAWPSKLRSQNASTPRLPLPQTCLEPVRVLPRVLAGTQPLQGKLDSMRKFGGRPPCGRPRAPSTPPPPGHVRRPPPVCDATCRDV